jgi:lipopolysaccharide export LptBFGC system permease protein LptF
MLLAVVFSVISGWIWLDLAPRSQRELRAVAVDLAGRALLGRIQPGSFQAPISGVTFFADTQTPDGTFGGVFIEDATSQEQTIRLVAKEAVIKADTATQSLKAQLGNGTGFIIPVDCNRPASALTFESMEFNIPIGEELNRNLDFLPVSLSSTTQELLLPPPPGQNPERWSFRLWTRIAAPFGFLAIAILSTGLALGLAISKRGLAIAVSAILFLVYHLLGRFCESLLDMNIITGALAALAPVMIISTVGVLVLCTSLGRKRVMSLN